MTAAGYLLAKILFGLFTFAGVRGIVLAFDIEARIKRVYGLTISHRKIRGIALITAAIAGASMIVGWEVFHLDERLQAPETTPPSEFSRSAYAADLRKFMPRGANFYASRFPRARAVTL